MTTDSRPARRQRVGAQRFDRYLTVIVAVFGLLYALQTLDALVADWPAMAGPAGAASVALVACSVLLGLAAAVLPRAARGLFTGAAALFCAAVVVWPFAMHGPVPGTPMPWFVGLLPVQAAYLTSAFRRVVVAAVCAVLLTGAIAVLLVVPGGLPVADAAVNGLFGATVAAVLALLIGAVRRGVAEADLAQQTALSRYGRSRFDEATESERARTDALVHDSVLTTFLSAADATTPAAEELARRMAANALRVLAHVNRSATLGPAIPLGKSLTDSDEALQPLLPSFDLELGALPDLVLPVDVAEAVVAALVASMAASVEHAPDATARSVRMSELGPDGIRIVVADDGVEGPTEARLTAHQDVALRMRAVDGRADLQAVAPRGTAVTLSWGSVVVSGVAPLPADAEVLA